ncbi:MAG: methyltransferase domain-containing protein [Deltaproteobacteria bacterium]|nr:methyltransferase domain-containing protein [Deltaproteobacteria bacterium]
MTGAFDKGIIKRAFSKAAATYDSHSGLQGETAREVSALLPLEPGVILDAGCGTGGVMEYVKALSPSAQVYGFDIARAMLGIAGGKPALKGARLACADCESLPFKDSSFDAVVSNMAYQWVEYPEGAFGEAWRVLRPGGVFIFSTLGPGTFIELRRSIEEAERLTGRNGLPRLMDFADAEELLKALEAAGFGGIKMEERKRERRYNDLRELLRTLKFIGAVNPSSGGKNTLSRGSTLKETSKIYLTAFPYPEGGIRATYDVILATAYKT